MYSFEYWEIKTETNMFFTSCKEQKWNLKGESAGGRGQAHWIFLGKVSVTPRPLSVSVLLIHFLRFQCPDIPDGLLFAMCASFMKIRKVLESPQDIRKPLHEKIDTVVNYQYPRYLPINQL